MFSGYFEIDAKQRINKAMYLGKRIGASVDPVLKSVRYPEEFFKVVKITTPTHVHGFNFQPGYASKPRQCQACGKPLW